MSTPDGVGARLARARERAGLTQQAAAEVVGTAREVISYWEHGRRLPGLAQLARLADAYGTTVDYLTGRAPEPASADEQALIYRDLDAHAPRTRAAVRRWLTFLDEWADLLAECGDDLPGRYVPPQVTWRAARPVTDTRRARTLARQVRDHYRLGQDAVPDLLAFLDEQGILVGRAALGPLAAPGGVSGIFYNHPRLGACILVNTDTTPGRQAFTLAHEFAHALAHYQETGLVSRASDDDPRERFADTFAAHFLVPADALQALVAEAGDRVADPYAVIRLQRYFRVSYAMLLNRLRSEGLLTAEQYAEYQGYSPRALAARLGLDTSEYGPAPATPEGTLGAYPPSVLERVRALIGEEALSPPAAASLLGVSQEAVLSELLATPATAGPAERREFDELPPPRDPRRARAAGAARA